MSGHAPLPGHFFEHQRAWGKNSPSAFTLSPVFSRHGAFTLRLMLLRRLRYPRSRPGVFKGTPTPWNDTKPNDLYLLRRISSNYSIFSRPLGLKISTHCGARCHTSARTGPPKLQTLSRGTARMCLSVPAPGISPSSHGQTNMDHP